MNMGRREVEREIRKYNEKFNKLYKESKDIKVLSNKVCLVNDYEKYQIIFCTSTRTVVEATTYKELLENFIEYQKRRNI